jgi:uncharacterized protein (TIGR03067 family)
MTRRMPTADSLGKLRAAYEAHEQRAAALAERLRQPAAGRQERSGDQKRRWTELRQAVEAAFAARQELQRAELAALGGRVRRLEQTIDSRESLRQQIIDRRVEDLLNPAIAWDARDQARANVPSTSPDFVAQIEGDWYLDSITGPNILSHEQGIRVTVTPDSWTVWRGDVPARYRLVLRTDTVPNQIDLIVERDDGRAPVVMRGIIKLFDQSIMTAWTNSSSKRPTEFGGDNVGVHTYRRFAATTSDESGAGDSPDDDPSVSANTLDGEAASADQPSRSAQSARQEWPAATPDGSGLLLRTPDEYLRLLRESFDTVRKAEAGNATRDELTTAQERYLLIREELAAQLQLLELELRDAQGQMELSAEELARREKLYQAQAISQSELGQAQRDLTSARFRADRAKTLLELFRKVDAAPGPATEAEPATTR